MPNQIPLIVDRRGSVLSLSLNNPSKKNALNTENKGALFDTKSLRRNDVKTLMLIRRLLRNLRFPWE